MGSGVGITGFPHVRDEQRRRCRRRNRAGFGSSLTPMRRTDAATGTGKKTVPQKPNSPQKQNIPQKTTSPQDKHSKRLLSPAGLVTSIGSSRVAFVS